MMQLIVLGYLPGTSVQIDFDFLATVFCVVSLVYLFRLMYKEKSHILNEAINTIQYITF